MKNKIGTSLMILGGVFVLSALALLTWNIRDAKRAEESISYIMPQLVGSTAVPQTETEETTESTEADDINNGGMADYSIGHPTVKMVDGYSYIGFLSFPTLDLELPVMEQWDYKRLRIAPCRYSGSIATDDLVVAAHNYKKHFGTLKTLNVGDTVYFTDMDNNIYTYRVAKTEILQPTAIEEMKSGEYDLTLFTCTYGGKTRVTVRCMRTDRDKAAVQ
jgi:sortase A